MKHLFILFALILITSCSGDSIENNQNPTIENISATTATIGSTIIINGKNFDPNKTYEITFNGVKGQITEVTSTSISVKIPTGATSGEIQLTVNGTTIIVGNITINSTSRLFAYKQNEGIIELNLSTGAEIGNIISTGTDEIVELHYLASTNEIIGEKIVYDNNGNESFKFFRLKLSDNTITETNFDGYENLIVTTTGKIYAYKPSEGIIEINASTGVEIGNVINTGTDEIVELHYLATTNEIIGEKIVSDNNGNESFKFFRLKLSDNTITETNFDGYENLIVTTTGKIYAYKPSEGIIEINASTGAEIGNIISTGTDEIVELHYLVSTNEIIGEKIVYDNNGNESFKFFRLKLSDNTITETNFDGYDSLIVVN